jgi:hypothetical protein
VEQLTKVLPEFEFSERHERHVAAPPDRVYRATRDLRVAQVPILRLLMALRWLPAIVTGDKRPLSPGATAVDEAVQFGFVVAWDRVGDGYGFVGIGRYWRLDSGIRQISGLDEFLDFSEHGFAKLAVGVAVEPDGSDQARVVTETRVATTDASARRRFAPYWRLIQPGSAMIRRGLLGAIAAEAERSGATPPRAHSR